jgi:hypothetical protein
MCLLAVVTGNPASSGRQSGRIASARLFVARHMGEAIHCVAGEGGALLPSAARCATDEDGSCAGGEQSGGGYLCVQAESDLQCDLEVGDAAVFDLTAY